MIRLDHFRASPRPGTSPRGRRRRRRGSGSLVPGADLFDAIKKELGALPFIAEDLGVITPDVARFVTSFIAGDAGTPVRLRRSSGQPASARQLRYQHGGVHRHPRQSHHARMVRRVPAAERQNLWSYLKRPGGESEDARRR